MEQKNINPIEEATDIHLKDSFIESPYDRDYFQCMVSMSSLACANCKGNHFISSSISSKIKFLGIFSGLIIHHSILDKITNLRIRIQNNFFLTDSHLMKLPKIWIDGGNIGKIAVKVRVICLEKA